MDCGTRNLEEGCGVKLDGGERRVDIETVEGLIGNVRLCCGCMLKALSEERVRDYGFWDVPGGRDTPIIVSRHQRAMEAQWGAEEVR